jgi:hypothetical protein
MRLFIFFTMIFGSLYAQKSMTLEGRVVEIKENKTVGVPGVVVSVSGESYDVTGPDGQFKLYAPEGLSFVTVTIKGSSSTMISPFDGKVNLPPLQKPIEIKLCQEQNKKLLTKIDQLQTKVKSLQQAHRLSAREVESLYRQMADTILRMESQLERSRQELVASNLREKILKERLEELEKMNAELENKLFLALGESSIARQRLSDSITIALNEYSSRLKDLQLILPTDAMACIRNTPGACPRFYGYIEKYNAARNTLNARHTGWIQSAATSWKTSPVSDALQATCDYILRQIHEPILFGRLNKGVLDPIKARSQGQLKSKPAQKTVGTQSVEIASELNPMIEHLDVLKNNLFQLLSHSVQ